jgi:predicted TIM-barrel fold metal-dependent hydrolase
MKLFSVDDHIVEPADVWTKRVPAAYRDRAPHVVAEDGREHWAFEDRRVTTMGLNAVVGRPPEDWDREPVRFTDMRPGCYDPGERARDLVSEGVVASLAFPTLPRFGGALFPSFDDKILADYCVRAWNDFLFEEWCPAAPEVFVPMIVVQLWDPTLAAKEIERGLARGARAVTMPEETSHLGLPSYYDPSWEPIWRICEAAGIPVCMHIGSSGWKPFIPEGAPVSLLPALGFVPTVTHSVGMAFGPVPRKFPGIKIVYAEGGIGWVPHTLERADSRYKAHARWAGTDDLLPSEVFRRNFWFCMMPDEEYGIAHRDAIGVDRIVWETDYPHNNCPWPDTERIAAAMLKDLSPTEIDLITHQNAEGLFNWTCRSKDELGLPARRPL